MKEILKNVKEKLVAKYLDSNSSKNTKKFKPRLKARMRKNKQIIGKNIDNLFVNQGPGKFSGIRASLAIAKALSFANKIDLYGFNSNQIINKNYVEIIDLFNKGALIKNLIKPQY